MHLTAGAFNSSLTVICHVLLQCRLHTMTVSARIWQNVTVRRIKVGSQTLPFSPCSVKAVSGNYACEEIWYISQQQRRQTKAKHKDCCKPDCWIDGFHLVSWKHQDSDCVWLSSTQKGGSTVASLSVCCVSWFAFACSVTICVRTDGICVTTSVVRQTLVDICNIDN